jgi:hypothetical protein
LQETSAQQETKRIQLFLFGMQDMTFGPYLEAAHVLRPERRPKDGERRGAQEKRPELFHAQREVVALSAQLGLLQELQRFQGLLPAQKNEWGFEGFLEDS